MTHEDVPACLVVIAECWGRPVAGRAEADMNDAFSPRAFRPTLYVAEMDGAVVGMAGYATSHLGYGIHEMCWVGTRVRYRRMGVARALVNRCLTDLRDVTRIVLLLTSHAGFYEALGFSRVAVVSCDEEDDVLMLHRCDG